MEVKSELANLLKSAPNKNNTHITTSYNNIKLILK